MEDIFERLYDMTAFSNIIAEPQFLIMYAIAFILLYLGIKKKYEPLLLIPIAFGVLLANFPGGEMGVVQADENGMVMVNGALKNIWEMPLHEIAHDLGLMNFIYYMLIKTGFLPPIIFMGVGALTDFGPMLRNLRLSIFGAAAQLGIQNVGTLYLYFASEEFINIPVGAYCIYKNITYYLMDPDDFKKKSSRNFEYTLVMYDIGAILGKYKCRDIVSKRLKFDYTAKPHEHLQ